MSRHVQKISHLLKIATEGNYLSKLPYSGKVYIHRNHNNEWGHIFVEKDLFYRRRNDLLGDDTLKWKLPDIDPHISIFTKEEVKNIPQSFVFPETLSYLLTGQVNVIEPKEWIGVSECIFETVICQDIMTIRKQLGFSEYLYGNHEFHITLGIRK